MISTLIHWLSSNWSRVSRRKWPKGRLASVSKTKISKISAQSETPSTTSSPSWVEALAGAFTSSALEERLGYHFADPDRLRLALTHRSWCAEHPGDASNERIEFLGDAVLGLVVTDHVVSRFPELPEGQLAKTKASIVSAATLADIGAGLGLGDHLRLGKGEDSSGGRHKPSIIADAVEAVIGAIYLDGGMDPAREFILTQLDDRIKDAASRPGELDYKTRLQEVVARDGHRPPTYAIRETGPDHHKTFHATVAIDADVLGAGEGTSKKEAEQRAARAAWESRTTRDGAIDV